MFFALCVCPKNDLYFSQLIKSQGMGKPEGISQNGTTFNGQRDKKGSQQEIIWTNVFLFGYMHVAALYGIILVFTSAKIATTLYGMFNVLDHLIVLVI